MHSQLTLLVRKIQRQQSVTLSGRYLTILSSERNFTKYNQVEPNTRRTIMKHSTSIILPAALLSFSPIRTYSWISRNPTSIWKNTPSLSTPPQRRDTLSCRMMATMDTSLDVAASDEEIIKIAEGTILAQYPGGFTAIRINDANGFLEPTNDPVVVGVGTAASTPTREVNKISSTNSINSISNGIKLTSIDYQGKAVTYPSGDTGVVIAHRPPLVFCYSDSESISSNHKDDIVTVMNEMVQISFSPRHSHVDGFGNPIGDNDTTGSSLQSAPEEKKSTLHRVIFGPIPKVSEIALINNPMITGNTMIDTLAPIGRGQNMLLIGSQLDDMRAVARDFLKTQIITTKQSSSPTVCVYASTEQDQNVAYERIKNAGIASDVHYVGPKMTSKTKDDTSYAAEAVLVVNSAIAIAESYALKEGCHTVVVVDTIDLHKTLHDATTRILVDTFGIQSVVQQDPNGGGTSSSEMRSFYSSFIQRAGQYNTKMGGGSVTLLLLTTIPPTVTMDPDEMSDQIYTLNDFEQCSENVKNRLKIIASKGIPLTAATLHKINIPLPTITEYDRRMQLQHIDELISMSDGQIWFDDSITTRPPMDPQKSITRIGVGADTPSRADAPAIRRIAEGIRLELVQSAMSSMTGTELSSTATQKQMRRQQALLLAMYQPPGAPIRRLSDSCVVLLSARSGYLDQCIDQNILAGSDDGISFIQQLLLHVHTNIKDVMNEIDETLDITDSSKAKLTQSIAEFCNK